MGEIMHRFFVKEENITDKFIRVNGKDVNHIKNVLRMEQGDQLELIGEKFNYICVINEVLKEEILLSIITTNDKKNESPVIINLYQGLPKSTKMETIVQKCTEIGVTNFFPVATYRSVVKITDYKKETKKIERWQAIAEEAAKQSRRDIIPTVNSILSFKEMILNLKGKTVIVPYEDEDDLSIGGLKATFSDTREINIVIGPEGGFEDSEIENLKDIGSYIVSLGPRILRTETAGIVTATILLYEFGDIGVIK